jgi:MFS_1 like family
MSVEHELSVTTVFSRSPNNAWVVRSLFTSLRRAVRGLRVASPFLPALLHERGLGPSEIGAVLAAGTAVRLITGPLISRLADRLGKHRQTLAVLIAIAAVIAFGYGLPAGFAMFLLVSVAHASALAPIVPIADAMTLAAAPGRFPIRVGARCGVSCLCRGRRGRWPGCRGNEPRRHRLDERDDACARCPGGAATTPKCSGSARDATASQCSRIIFRCVASCLSWRWRRWFSAAMRCTMASRCCAGRKGALGRARRGYCGQRGSWRRSSFSWCGSNAAEAAWASRRGRAGGQRGNGPLERHCCHRLAPGNGSRGTAAWTNIRPVAPCLHADAVCDYPAGAGCDSSGVIRHCRRRRDDRHRNIGVGSTLRCARPARVLVYGVVLCRCVARRVCDAQDLD